MLRKLYLLLGLKHLKGLAQYTVNIGSLNNMQKEISK